MQRRFSGALGEQTHLSFFLHSSFGVCFGLVVAHLFLCCLIVLCYRSSIIFEVFFFLGSLFLHECVDCHIIIILLILYFVVLLYLLYFIVYFSVYLLYIYCIFLCIFIVYFSVYFSVYLLYIGIFIYYNLITILYYINFINIILILLIHYQFLVCFNYDKCYFNLLYICSNNILTNYIL